jgi:hypothetical protein
MEKVPGTFFLDRGGKGSRNLFSIAAAAACLLYIGWRGYDTYPAVDRSWDHRPEQVLSEFTKPPNVPTLYFRQAIFGVDANWQVQNAFEYFMKRSRPGVAWFTTDDLQWLSDPGVTEKFRHFTMVNTQAGREVVVTPDVAAQLRAHGYQLSFSNLDDFERSQSLALSRERVFASQIGVLRPRTTYALGILRPNRESPLDLVELTAAWTVLTGGTTALPTLGTYTIVLGETGQRPALVESRDRPFRLRMTLDTADFDVRMESWLPTDTIRRAGFGQVIVNRRHVLILERGVSFVALGPLDEPALVLYRSGIFAPLGRLMPWSCPGATPCRP